ncbi:MAG: response regulator, partial [bacterium]
MKPKILIIEDQETIGFVLKEFLNEHGFVAEVALNGEEALTKFRATAYHLLLTDFKLPDMDGNKVVAACKIISPELKVLFITGYKKQLCELESKIASDFQVIAKPCRPQ